MEQPVEITPNRNFQFILKPSLACNLACSYCYAAKMRADATSRMSRSEARQAIDWAMGFCREFKIENVSFLWQGGEPLLVGAEYIAEIASYCSESCEKLGIGCENLIQTNLLLMSNAMLPVIKKHFNSQVGFSYDYRSATRVYPNGVNAMSDIWGKALWCRQQGLSIGAICQITPENVDDMRGLYDTFKSAGVHFKISQVFPTQNSCSASNDDVSVERSAEAVCELFDIWMSDPSPTIEISNLRGLVASILRGKSYECCRQESCVPLLLSLIPGKRILPCARFDNSCDVIGLYGVDSPRAVMNARLRHAQSDCVDRACCSCRYRSICNGGCYYNRLTGWHEAECKSNKIILSHIEKYLQGKGMSMGCLGRVKGGNAA